MANRALRYHKTGKYHFEKIRKEYKKKIESMNLAKIDKLNVMDIGCGSGRALYEVLLPQFSENISEVVGTDMDADMIEFCRSMKQYPKVSFDILDIADENLPKHFLNRFHLLFSSFCFSHVRNLRQGFSNCKNLLRPNGELLFIFQFKTHALYSTYQKMSSIHAWKSNMEDYTYFTTHFSGPDPDSELKNIFKGSGLTLLDYKFEPDFHIHVPKREVLGIYQSLDTKIATIPKDQQDSYMKDFVRTISEVTNVNFVDERTLDHPVEFNVPTVCVHAKKEVA